MLGHCPFNNIFNQAYSICKVIYKNNIGLILGVLLEAVRTSVKSKAAPKVKCQEYPEGIGSNLFSFA